MPSGHPGVALTHSELLQASEAFLKGRLLGIPNPAIYRLKNRNPLRRERFTPKSLALAAAKIIGNRPTTM
jgi:hypothetical protein